MGLWLSILVTRLRAMEMLFILFLAIMRLLVDKIHNHILDGSQLILIPLQETIGRMMTIQIMPMKASINFYQMI